MLKRGVVFLVSTFFILSACRTRDPEAIVPAYIYIPEFEIDNSLSSTGLEIFSTQISDVWVYIDNDNQGAYELPALIPLTEIGTKKLELRPGIKNAGISTQRRPYPYYKQYIIENYPIVSGNTDTIIPITHYADDPIQIKFSWEEGFETANLDYEINPASDTVINIVDSVNQPDLVFRDAKSGEVILQEPGFFFEMNSPILTNLPFGNIPIYLEINYKSTHPFTVGLYRNNKREQFPVYVLREQEEWNKIYLDFSQFVQTSTPGSNFNIFIGFVRNPDIPRMELYLDNIKLLHY